jgi:hypothetical protein
VAALKDRAIAAMAKHYGSARLPHCPIPVMRVQATTIAPIGLKLGRHVDLTPIPLPQER